MADFVELIARLEAASEGSRELDSELAVAIGDMNDPNFDVRHYVSRPTYEVHYPSFGSRGPLIGARITVGDHSRIVAAREPKNYTTSLDAALTLVPDSWRWLLDKRPWGEQRQDGFRAEVYLPAHPYRSDRADVPTHWGPTPALAICAAALKARVAEAERW